MTNSITREHLSSIDTAWYRVEMPGNHANIGGLLFFDEPLDFDRVREVVEERLVDRFPQFRHRVVESPGKLGRPHWEAAPEFSIDDHLRRESLDPPGDRAQLQRRAAALMSGGLDLDRPLWQIHQIDDYRGGSVLLAQLHHCLGDGFALARVLLSIADEGYDLDAAVSDERRTRGLHRSLGGRLLEELKRRLAHPEGREKLSREIGDVAREMNHLASMASDPPTLLKRPPNGELDVAWSGTYSLAELKDLAHSLDATLNDLLMAGVTSALRRFLIEHGEPVDDIAVRAIVPVNLRPVHSIEQMEATLGNEFGLVFLELPIFAPTPERQLAELKTSIEALKESPEAAVLFGILTVGGSATAPIERIVQNYFSDRASLVVSNVLGPAARLRIAGNELSDLMFWVPHPGPNLGLGISLISYAGRFSIGVRMDTALGGDPESFVESIDETFGELRKSVRRS